ncbi:MAG: hypothetical protein IJO76_05035 [Clostridia bacterium]|nr:hypothetical protein [Clostridia bacterium]
MKRYRYLTALLLSFVGVVTLTLSVSANSSWRWISETRPYDVLPFVVVLTLVVEIGGLCALNQIGQIHKCGFYVILGNLLSFAAPYILLRLFPAPPYEFAQTLEHTPFYTVGAAYLVLTVLIEVPVVYTALRKTVGSRKQLLVTLLCLNVITTVLTAVAERVFCQGTW